MIFIRDFDICVSRLIFDFCFDRKIKNVMDLDLEIKVSMFKCSNVYFIILILCLYIFVF